MSSSEFPLFKKLIEKLNEEKSGKYSVNSNKEMEMIIKEISKHDQRDRTLEEKIKTLEIKIAKLAIAAIVKHKIKKISKTLSLGSISFPYFEILSGTEVKLRKRISEKLSLAKIISEQEIPVIEGLEGVSYGPLKNNDIVFIPEELSSLLIKKKFARSLEDESS